MCLRATCKNMPGPAVRRRQELDAALEEALGERTEHLDRDR